MTTLSQKVEKINKEVKGSLGVTHYRIGWELSSYEDGTFFNVDEPLYKENGGYGMPVREKPYCKLEKEHKPCEKVEDLPNDSYKPKEIGA